MNLGDFHIHSTFSDGKLTVPEIVDLYGKRGFGTIAITDHLCESTTVLGKASSYLGCTLTKATFPLYIEILKSEKVRAMEQYGMLLIPGVELTKNSVSNHRSAHVLALGITDYISADGDISELVKRIHKQGAIAVAAHPVWTRKIEKQTFHLWDRREEYAHLFDAWEVASGPYLFPKVEESGLPMLASSDLHKLSHLTSWKTELPSERHQEAILQAIRRQDLQFRYFDAGEAKGQVHGVFPRPSLGGINRDGVPRGSLWLQTY